MESNGTRQIAKRGGLLAARAILPIFVAWGSILAMTSAYVVPFNLPVDTYWRDQPNTTRYTHVLVTATTRGWPLQFDLRTSLRKWPSPFEEGIRRGPLLGDLGVLGILVAAAWFLPRPRRLQASLADLLGLTASLAVTLAFHASAWGRELGLPQLAVDVGVFSAVVVALHIARRFARRRTV
jgi:hypothetical protein